MAQKWTDKQLGKRSNGGIENESMRTGFVPLAPSSLSIPFGRGLVQKTGAENEVLLFGTAGGSKQFVGFSAFSQEATGYSNTFTGPAPNYAVYPVNYKNGDVVGLIDRGSVIAKVDANSTGIQAGDQICVLANGLIDAVKNITKADADVGAKKGISIDAFAESNAVAGDCIGIQIYSLASTPFSYN
ncbi:MAG: structural cement protein Gp24 [Cetobacterium sp.]